MLRAITCGAFFCTNDYNVMARIITDEAFVRLITFLRQQEPVAAYEGLLKSEKIEDPEPARNGTPESVKKIITAEEKK